MCGFGARRNTGLSSNVRQRKNAKYKYIGAQPVHGHSSSKFTVSVVRPRQVRFHRPKSPSPPQRTRNRSRCQRLHFLTGTWRHLLWQINQHAFNALRAALPKCSLGGALRRGPLRVSTVGRHPPALCNHRLRSRLWRCPTTCTARKPVAPNTVRSVVRWRCLTLRSRRAPTAGHQARSGGTRYIFASPGLASCRCRPLSRNR